MLALVPATGRVLLDGQDVAATPRATLARRIAYLPQGQTLHWPLTVERLVGLGRLPHLAPMSKIAAADSAAIARAMERADVLDLKDRIATELSGGERARTLFARALAVEAPALIADEPLDRQRPVQGLSLRHIGDPPRELGTRHRRHIDAVDLGAPVRGH